MRVRSPVSRASISIRFSGFDLVWALASPLLALWVRGAQSLTSDLLGALTYCAIAFLASVLSFLVFRIRDGMTHLFSVHDALEVAKSVLLAESLSCLILFSTTRLEGIPRSTPIIHGLILGAGLVASRALVRALSREPEQERMNRSQNPEHIIIIGSNRLSALYVGFLRAYGRGQYQIVGVLDDRPEMMGRSVAGVKVLGPLSHLSQIMQEFLDHGIRTDRVLVGADPDSLPQHDRAEFARICAEYQIPLQFIPELIGLHRIAAERDQTAGAAAAPSSDYIAVSNYFAFKRYFDFCFALVLLIGLSPFFALASLLVLLDMGSPIFFWQRRIGMHGRAFQLHKLRTLKPSFDRDGLPIADTNRMSNIGAFLRRVRLDELPQLLNVLVGDMSLIGPRPLLPEDQPANPAVRLSVRPGITGWAQVNGGRLIDPEAKNKLDEWYVRNASPWLDCKILFWTMIFMLAGEKSDDVHSAPMAEPPLPITID